MTNREMNQRFDRQPKWVHDYTLGLAGSRYYYSVVESTHFGVVCHQGHTSYIDRGSGLQYSPTEFVLVKKGENYWGSSNRPLAVGRLTNFVRQRLQSALAQAEEALKTCT